MELNYFNNNTIHNTMTFKEQIEKYLSGLPSKWAEQLTEILCQIKAEKQEPDCQTVKDCETVTSLSPFTVNGTIVSIQYKDEKGITVTRSFDTSQILNESLNDIEAVCLTDEVTWESLSFAERIQLIINTVCNCSGTGPVIEYDFTDECDITGPVVFTLMGAEGQGVYAFELEYGETGSFALPVGLTGLFHFSLLSRGTDNSQVRIRNSGNSPILTPINTANGFAYNPATFDIEELDNILITCA